MNIKIIPKKLHGTISAMPSKSHAHRVLIAQKLAQLQGTEKREPLFIPDFSDDIKATKNCLTQLDKNKPYLDCKESGSTLRFLLPVAMAVKNHVTFMGSGKLPYRPISPLKEEMEAHGCRFIMGSSKQNDKYKEICTITGKLTPGQYRLPGNISSQFITGLLLALPLLDGDSTLSLTTKLESAGYVSLTIDVLRDFGIRILTETSEDGFPVYKISGRQTYSEPDGLSIEGDWSNAAFWLACGALGGDIECTGLKLTSSQKDKAILDILEKMGAETNISVDMNGIAHASCRVHSTENSTDPGIIGTNVDVSQTPDLVPVLASVMSLAKGASMITGAERLKIKESDRLRTVFDFIYRLNGDITYGGTGLSITGVPFLTGGEVESHNDHRIAMAAAVASCGCREPVIIKNAEAVKKSYPGFFDDFAALGGEVIRL